MVESSQTIISTCQVFNMAIFWYILGYQIEIEIIFNVVGIFTSLRWCQLKVENLKKMVFIYQNWPNDAKLDYKIAKGFVHDFFEVEDVILDDHEQLFINVSYYENAWWVCGSWHLIFLCNMWQDVVYEIEFVFW